MKINAYAIHAVGGTAEPFLYERTLGRRDVLVKITHRSLARGDIQFIDNAWGDTRFPLVPSHEIVGIVEQAGPDVIDLHSGDRVGIGYQQEACFECAFCTQGIEQLCANQKVIAVDCHGGLAEHIVVDGRFAFRLPPQLDSATSTPLLSSGLTVYAGIRSRPTGRRLSSGGAGRRRARSSGHPVPSQDGARRDRVIAIASASGGSSSAWEAHSWTARIRRS